MSARIPLPGKGTRLLTALASLVTGLSLAWNAQSAPLVPSQLPDELKDWVPWAMQGHEWLSCPPEHADNSQRACLWPEQLDVDIQGRQARFRARVTVHGSRQAQALPGEAGSWPAEVRNEQGQLLPVVNDNGRPVVWLPPGRHQLSGRIQWELLPQTLRTPRFGLVGLQLDGEAINPVADREGRVWLRKSAPSDDSAVYNTLTMEVRRLIDDDIPRHIVTRYQLDVAGEVRDADLGGALLANTMPMALRSNLPARLHPDGRLQVQLRPGSWFVEVEALQTRPVETLTLPAGSTQKEVWSYKPYNDLHVTHIQGAEPVDPGRAEVPGPWQSLAAYQVTPDTPMQITVNSRGNAFPGAGELSLKRELWLDFDGKGMTQKDEIQGTLSDQWRLHLQGPAELGHASVDGTPLPVTRLDGQPGIELRDASLNLMALARIEDHEQPLMLNGWNTVMRDVRTRLNLPPGWMLLHASGVDTISPPTLTSQWRLFDFFFLLLTTIAAFHLLGGLRAGVLLAMLLLVWHSMPFLSQVCLVLMALLGIRHYLSKPAHHRFVRQAAIFLTVLLALGLVPHTLEQIRLITYPALEYPQAQTDDDVQPVDRPLQTYNANFAAQSALADHQQSARSKAASPRTPGNNQEIAVDPTQLNIQTGPGEPGWRWNLYELHNEGDVVSTQPMQLTLLSVWPTRLFRTVQLLLIYAGLFVVLRPLLRRAPHDGDTPATPAAPEGSRPPAAPDAPGTPQGPASAVAPTGGATAASLALALMLGAGLLLGSPAAQAAFGNNGTHAAPAAEAAASKAADTSAPRPGSPAMLQAVRERLYPGTECAPHCAAVGQMQVDATRHQLRLRLSIHAQEQVQVPLPAHDATDNWRMTHLLLDGKPATTRRDGKGMLWALLPAGIHQAEISGPIGAGTSIRLNLPMKPQMLTVQGEQWKVSGLKDGLPADGVLNLDLHAVTPKGETRQELVHVPDALPSFALVERTLTAHDRWRVQTRITRRAVSQAPVWVRFALLPGESVNGEGVQVKDGIAEVHLGRSNQIVLHSTLPPQAQLRWHALANPAQIEVWHLHTSPLWHTSWHGLAPTTFIQHGQLMPMWQPWPGESVTIDFTQPTSIPGPTRTLEKYRLIASPGTQSTEFEASMLIRASLAGIQPMRLPEGGQLLSLTIDGNTVPLQSQDGSIGVPISPGEHVIRLRWREAHGTGGWAGRFTLSQLDTGLPGTNAATHLKLPQDRVPLLAGGPLPGPAILFWTLIGVLAVVAVVLGRWGATPLGSFSWLVLLAGVAPASLGTNILLILSIVGFCLVAQRAPQITKRFDLDPRQLLAFMIFLAVIVMLMLYGSVKSALLGYPDMVVTGNGSSTFEFNWYQDRFDGLPEHSWIYSISLTLFRGVMLVWALWMAFSVIGWIRWGIRRFTEVSHLPPPPPKPAAKARKLKSGSAAAPASPATTDAPPPAAAAPADRPDSPAPDGGAAADKGPGTT